MQERRNSSTGVTSFLHSPIDVFSLNRFCILIKISMKFVHEDPTDINSTLVQVMAQHQTTDMPLPKPMVTQFIVTVSQAWMC